MSTRILVAGIGNIFLGDDGFGVEVARRLLGQVLPDGVTVKDYGIRGMDLAYALMDEYDAVIFLDAMPRGETPGTLYLIEPRIDDNAVSLDTHGMDPVKVLALARHLGAPATRIFILGCEPERIINPEEEPDIVVELSAPVQAALDEAVSMAMSLLVDLCSERRIPAELSERR